MSLTSYRAAPPRVSNVYRGKPGSSCWFASTVVSAGGLLHPASKWYLGHMKEERFFYYLACAFRRPGGDLLSHTLRCSTIGAEGFHCRVRDGIGCRPLAITTRSWRPDEPHVCHRDSDCPGGHGRDVSHVRCALLRRDPRESAVCIWV